MRLICCLEVGKMKSMSKYEFYGIICLLLVMTLPSSIIGNSCDANEKCLTSLEIAADLVAKLLPNCFKVAGNASECGAKDKVSAYIDMTNKFISEAKENFPTCIERKTKCTVAEHQPKDYAKNRDCSEVMRSGQSTSGVYAIWPDSPVVSNRCIEVFCDMDNQGGGWTVIQRRGNFTPQEDFYRGWKDYKNGFGHLTRDFWLGNDNLYILSNQGNYTIRFDLTSKDDVKAYALYKTFRVEDEMANYTLHIDGYSGNAGDSMSFHNGMRFSTKDRTNYKGSDELSCAEGKKGGWWYIECTNANLNGDYNATDRYSNIHWDTFKYFIGLASVEIKMKIL